MFTKTHSPASTRRTSAPSAMPRHPDVQQALAVLHSHFATAKPKQTPRPVATPNAPHQKLADWGRVERCTVFLVNPQLAPVAVPLRRQPGFATLNSGRPAIRFVAEGFAVNGRTLAAYVAPDHGTGLPRVVHAEGASQTNFKIQG